jgi:hypothetical protein
LYLQIFIISICKYKTVYTIGVALMATGIKTIEYAFAMDTTQQTTGVAHSLAQLSALVIPESSPSFLSVTLEVDLMESGTAAASMSAIALSIQLAAVGASSATVTQTITNSGENQSIRVTRDVTSYFTTNWTGTSMTSNCIVTATGISTINVCAKLIITYSYDDTSTTQIKTVKIPINGNLGVLTTAFTTVGSTANQWPNLDTFLPELNKSYKDIFFEMETNTGTTAAASSGLTMRYDGSTSVADLTWAHTLNSATFKCRRDKLLGSITTNATHSVEALATSATADATDCLNGHIVVTYTFDYAVPAAWQATHAYSVGNRVYASSNYSVVDRRNAVHICTTAGTSGGTEPTWNAGVGATTTDSGATWTVVSTINSLQMSIDDEEAWMAGTTATDKNRTSVTVVVQEPGTIATVHSAIFATLIDAGAPSIRLTVDAQAEATYAFATAARCGCMTAQRRIDDVLALSRGVNSFDIDYYSTSATVGNMGSNLCLRAYINYTSGLHKDGHSVHAQTRCYLIRPHATGNLVVRLTAAQTTVPVLPANYWLLGTGYEIILMSSGTTGVNQLQPTMQVKVNSDEGSLAGWIPLYSGLYSSDTEVGPSLIYARGRHAWQRWPAEVDTNRLILDASHTYRWDSVTTNTFWQTKMYLTYSQITYAIAGNISGSSGGTVTIYAHITDPFDSLNTGTIIGTTSRTGNGAYSIPWYDNTVYVMVEAYESGSLIGRSDDGLAE